jgi:hypothetical protein
MLSNDLRVNFLRPFLSIVSKTIELFRSIALFPAAPSRILAGHFYSLSVISLSATEVRYNKFTIST